MGLNLDCNQRNQEFHAAISCGQLKSKIALPYEARLRITKSYPSILNRFRVAGRTKVAQLLSESALAPIKVLNMNNAC